MNLPRILNVSEAPRVFSHLGEDSREAEVFRDIYETLQTKYSRGWVAIADGEERGYHRNYIKLVELIVQDGLDSAYIGFVQRKPPQPALVN